MQVFKGYIIKIDNRIFYYNQKVSSAIKNLRKSTILYLSRPLRAIFIR